MFYKEIKKVNEIYMYGIITKYKYIGCTNLQKLSNVSKYKSKKGVT